VADQTELVTIQYPPTLSKREVPRGALSGFTNQGWVVLDSAGRVNSKATSTANNTSKE
jgi:hypothetical protein